MIAIACTTVMLACVAVLAHRLRHERATARAVRADRDRALQSIDHNLRGIRARVTVYSPEAAAVCDALQDCLPARCAVDFDLLERRLTALRRAHNAAILDAAGHEPAFVVVTETGASVVRKLDPTEARKARPAALGGLA